MSIKAYNNLAKLRANFDKIFDIGPYFILKSVDRVVSRDIFDIKTFDASAWYYDRNKIKL